MVEYFDKHYRNDILNHAVKFLLHEHNLYDPEKDMTNNISESLNSLLKKIANVPGISVDNLLIALYFFQRYKHNEILRGRLLVGDFKLKESYMDYILDPETVDMLTSVCTPEEIVEAVLADKLELPTVESVLPENATRLDDATDGVRTLGMLRSQRGLAKSVITEKRIVNVPEAGAWIVTGSKHDRHVVTLGPKETCSCPSLGGCYHIIAARMCTGYDTNMQPKEFTFTQLAKISRKRQNRLPSKKTSPAPR